MEFVKKFVEYIFPAEILSQDVLYGSIHECLGNRNTRCMIMVKWPDG